MSSSKVDVKVVLLGKHSVGKTCLVERYLHGKFRDSTVATVGAAFGAKKLTSRNKEVTLGIWDTAGQERYESMSRIYYRSAKAALVCFDLTDPKSFDKVKSWVEELTMNEEGCDIYVIGTKVDLIHEGIPRGRGKDEIEGFVKKSGLKYFETSAKNGDGIEHIFQDIADTFVSKGDHSYSTDSVTIQTVKPGNSNSIPEEKKKKCCE